MTVWRIKYNPA